MDIWLIDIVDQISVQSGELVMWYVAMQLPSCAPHSCTPSPLSVEDLNSFPPSFRTLYTDLELRRIFDSLWF